MEKIKVNMSPNPLDVQTIHASQNDGEARQWEFELHNNGELIDTSDVKEQMVFKAYKGGTEQLLPENGSTPTTSPFLGDIKYPDATRNDQEFTYRQSPTEEDGFAKITDIKGNTLNWNQLVPTNWVSTRTFSDGLSVTNNNDGSYTLNGTATQSRFPTRNTEIYGIQGHKYLIQVLSSQNKAIISQNGSSVYVSDKTIYTAQNNNAFIIYFNANTYNNEKIIPMIIDLTQMFGVGNEPSTVEEFTSLFPLSYYSYNQGSLLSFMGNGIKTVGKNLLPFDLANVKALNTSGTWNDNVYSLNQLTFKVNDDETIIVNGTSNAVTILDFILQGANNFVGCKFNGSSQTTDQQAVAMQFFNENNVFQTALTQYNNNSLTIPNYPKCTIRIRIGNGQTLNNVVFKPMIRNANVVDDTFEPYTSSTLSLPISTYFPDGMQGHGDTYDELTSAVATKRFEKDSLGELTWTRRTTNIFSANLPSEFDASKDISCFMSNRLPTVFVSGYTLAEDGYISIYKTTTVTSSTSIYLNMTSQSIDTVADLQTWLSNNPTELVYPLATPIETSFTTASLVTENAEIPLSNNDGVLLGKCTEQLSENPGFFDAKIKLADADGTCYSNKLQLHVERKPS